MRRLVSLLAGSLLGLVPAVLPSTASASTVNAVECSIDTFHMYIGDGQATGSAEGSCVGTGIPDLIPLVRSFHCDFAGTGTYNLLTARTDTEDVCDFFAASGATLFTLTVDPMTRIYTGPDGLVAEAGSGNPITGAPLDGGVEADVDTLIRTSGGSAGLDRLGGVAYADFPDDVGSFTFADVD